MQKNINRFFLSLITILILPLRLLAQTTESFNFQGELLNSDDTPVTSANVDLLFSIFDPTGSCLLYQERQNLDLQGSDGKFSVAVGSAVGGAKRSGTLDPGLTMQQIFKNGGLVRSSATSCPSGYTSTTLDIRKIQVTIANIDGVAVNQSLSKGDILSVPTATVAGAFSPLGTWSNNNFQISNVASPISGTDAVNKVYADSNLKGIPISGTPVTGDVLKYNGTSWVASPISGVGGGGSVTSVTAAIPISVTNSTTTPYITMAQANGSNSGYLSSADWNVFNNKLGNTLGTGMIFVGNTGIATPTTMTGDASLSSTGVLSLNTVPVTKGGTGITTIAANRLIASDATGSTLQAFTCPLNNVASFDASGNVTCQNPSGIFGSAPVVYGGNANAMALNIGTNDAFPVNIRSNSQTVMTLSPSSNVGIGTTTPVELLHVESNTSTASGIKIKNLGSTSNTAAALKLENAAGNAAMIYQATSSSILPGGPNAAGFGTTSSFPVALFTNSTERLRIDASGNIGINGVPSAPAKLKINQGSLVGDINIVATGSTADFSLGNTVVLQNVGGSSITLSNLMPGGKYTLVVEDTTSRTYTFAGCGGTMRFSPANTLTTGGYHTIYEIFSTGSNCYIKWQSGF